MRTSTKLLPYLAKFIFGIQILLFSTFFSACFAFGNTNTVVKADHLFTYNITVAESYRTKEILSSATQLLETSNRYITEYGFTFQSKTDYSPEYLQLVFLHSGVPSVSIVKYDGKMPVLSGEKVGGTDCDFAQLLCSNGAVPGNSAGFGTQELGASNQGCLIGNEHQSSWYYLNVQTGGSLTMLIDPAVNTDDYDFAIWGPFTAANAGANCPPVSAPIRCSFSALNDQTGLATMNNGTPSGCGFLGLFACAPFAVGDVSETSSGDSFVLPLAVSANQIYILLVDNFSTSSNPYSMTFGGSAVLGCTPVILPVEVSSFKSSAMASNSYLEFTTESEMNSDYFEIEWTTNPAANDWKTIETVYSKGDSQQKQLYSCLHTNPDLKTPNYYRLIQVDNNGDRRTYSKFAVVDFAQGTKTPVKVFNLLRQEVEPATKGIVIYVFEDGSSEKVVNP